MLIWRTRGKWSVRAVRRSRTHTVAYKRTRVCTVYMVNDRIGSPTFCGSSTVIENTGGIPLSLLACGDCSEGFWTYKFRMRYLST